MSQTFVPGYQATVTINSADLSAVGEVFRLNLGRSSLAKPVFSEWQNHIAGQRNGSFSASGSLSFAKIADIVALFDADDPVAFSIQMGTAASSTDLGIYSGNCNITSLTIEASADGQWEWSIDATIDGTATLTPGSSS